MIAFSLERVVEEIGPCWISAQKELPILVAIFSSERAIQLEKDNILNFLDFFKEKTKHLQNQNSVLIIKNISLHCGAYGSSLYFAVSYKNNTENTTKEEATYCIKAQKLKDGHWSLNWGLDPAYQNGQACAGITPEELLLNKEGLGQNWKERLEAEEIKRIILKWQEINSKWIKIFLTDKWSGLEKEAMLILIEKLNLPKSSSIDYQYWLNPIGDYYIFPKFQELD